MTGAAPTTILCDHLFDGDRVIAHARVVVDGGRIASVSPAAADTPAAEGAQRRCRFAMPGLIDAHTHISGYHEGIPAGQPFEPVKHFLRLCVANGVTTVRDTGNALETIAYAREWSSRYGGPRIFSAGPLLDTPPLTWAFSRIVRTADEGRRQVALLAAEGVDLIKAYRGITAEVLEAVVDAAREHGLGVAVDSQCCPVIAASRIGVRSLEHMANVVDPLPPQSNGHGPASRALHWAQVDPGGDAMRALGETLAAHGTFIVPTLLVTRRWTFFDELVGDPNLEVMSAVMPYHRHLAMLGSPLGQRIGRRFVKRYMPVAELSRQERGEAQRGLEVIRETLRAYHGLGIPIAAGTDSPNPSLAPGFSLHQELAEMVRAGLGAVDALRAATSGGARLIGREDLGAIRPGVPADLLLVDGRPDEQIGDLRTHPGRHEGRRLDRPPRRASNRHRRSSGELMSTAPTAPPPDRRRAPGAPAARSSSSDDAPVAEVAHLAKAFGSTVAVVDVSLSVAPASICALVGPNGAGKTTTVRCMLGLTPADSGRIRVLGLDPAADRLALFSRVGVKLQETRGVPDRLRVAEALRLHGSFYADPLAPGELLEQLGLTGKAQAFYRELSGGQKARLLVALALVGRPQLLVLDEPTTGLDPQARGHLWETLEAARAGGVAVLVTTHYIEEAEEHCDSVAIVDEGLIIATGHPEDLLEARGLQARVTAPASGGLDAERLRALPGVVAAESSGAHIHVYGGSDLMAAVTALTDLHGIERAAVATRPARLEDRYLLETGREYREE